MEQRHRAVLAVFKLGQHVEDVAKATRVHPDTLRRWLKRFLAEGLDGLVDRPRTPHFSPRRMPVELEERIVDMRLDHPHWGARRIRAELGRRGHPKPAASTVGAALRRNGLVSGRARKVKPTPRRFVAPRPNDLWQLDAWEQPLADGTVAYVIDLLDDHARVVLAARAVPTVDGPAVWAAFEEASTRWGLPARVLTDNARYFTGRLSGVVADFERRLWRLGVATINGRPSHPQTQGKIERFHRTARDYMARHGPPEDLAHLQALLDSLSEHYNFDRPHQGLNDLLPGDVFAATESAQPNSTASPCRSTLRRVQKGGLLRYGGWRINVGSEWEGWELEVVEQADKIRVVFEAELITSFSTEEPKGYIASGRPRGGIRRDRQ